MESPFTSIRGRLRGLLADTANLAYDAVRASVPGAANVLPLRTPSDADPALRGTPADLPTIHVSDAGTLRTILEEHDLGNFQRSASLAEWCLRDADLTGALLQRYRRLMSWPLAFLDETGEPSLDATATMLRTRWRRICPRQVEQQSDALAALLGFAVGQVVERWDEELGELVPEIIPWPSSAVGWMQSWRSWVAYTRDRGIVPITPGDGWMVYTPDALYRPWLWGVVRSGAIWCLRGELSAVDASRLSQVHGVPVWCPQLPAGAAKTPEGKAFLRATRDMGRNAVIPILKGTDEFSSYGLELKQPATDTYRIFEWMQRTAAGKMRLVLLGQDLTSQLHGEGARATSETGDDVTDDVVEASAESWADAVVEQVLVPWARRSGRPVDRYRPVRRKPVDHVRRAQALQTHGLAVKAWRDAGADVDVMTESRRAGIAVQGLVPVVANGAGA